MIVVIEQLTKMKIKATFILNNAAAVISIEKSIQIGDIAAAMNPSIAVERCLSMIHVRNGLKGNGSYLRNIEPLHNQADEPDGKNYAVFRDDRANLKVLWPAGYPQTICFGK